MAEDVSVAIVIRGRDEASVQLRQVGRAAQDNTVQFNAATQAAQNMGTQYANAGQSALGMGDQMRMALPSLATLGSSMASLLITTGALNSEMGRYVTIGLSLVSAASSAVPAIMGMVRVFRSLNIVMRATAVLQAIIAGLTGVGLVNVGLGLAAGAAVAVGIKHFAGLQQGGIVTQPTLALLGEAGPEAVIPLNRGTGASVTFINQGILMGNEADAQRLTEEIQRRIRESERLGR